MTEEKMYMAAWKRSTAVDQEMRLSLSQLFSHLHAILGIKRLYTLWQDKFLQ